MDELQTKTIETLREDITANYDALQALFQLNGETELQPSVESFALLVTKNPELLDAALLTVYPIEYSEYKNTANADGKGKEFLQKVGTGLGNAWNLFTGKAQQDATEESIAAIAESNAAIEEQASKYQTYAILVILLIVALVCVMVFWK